MGAYIGSGSSCKKKKPENTPIGAPGLLDPHNSVGQYLIEVSKIPMFSHSEERECAWRAYKGDQKARNELVRRNLLFGVREAKKYQNNGMELADLIQEANVGLQTAAEKFDPSYGVKFISYAVFWIRKEILEAMTQRIRIVRIPDDQQDKMKKIGKAIAVVEELQGVSTNEATRRVIESLGRGRETIEAAFNAYQEPIYLDAPVVGESGSTHSQFYPDNLEPATDELTLRANRIEAISSVCKEYRRLYPKHAKRDLKVVKMCFLDERTLDYVGERLGVTYERVRQLRNRATGRLREIAKRKHLEELF